MNAYKAIADDRVRKKLSLSSEPVLQKIYDELASAAAAIAQDRNINVSTGDAEKFIAEMLEDSWTYVQGTLTSQSHSETKTVWTHRDDLIRDVKGRRYLSGKSDIEAAVYNYLNSPLRSATLERIFTDLIVAFDYSDCCKTISNLPGHWLFGWMDGRPKPLLVWFTNMVFTITLAAFLSLAPFLLRFVGLSTLATWIASIIWFLAFCSVGLSTLFLPITIYRSAKLNSTIDRALMAAERIYDKLGSKGPVSSREISQLVDVGTQNLLQWSPALAALLDDISRRDGRF